MILRVTAAFFLCVPALALPIHLRVNARENPIGIDTARPVFSWQSNSTARNWKQTAYEVMVATSPQLLTPGKADVWDTGKVESDASIDVLYGGPALKSGERCYWAVRVWDNKGAQTVSAEQAIFEMGLLQAADWQAQWISHQDPAEQSALHRMQSIWLANTDAAQVAGGTVVDFRYRFSLEARPAAATLHVLNTDEYTVTVNGTKTGHKSEWSAFDFENIREELKQGMNEVIVHVLVPAAHHPDETFQGQFAAALHLEKPDGSSTWSVTGNGWQARAGTDGAWMPAQSLGLLQTIQHVRGGRVSMVNAPGRIESGASLLRKDFVLREHLATARLYITAMGAYNAYINGVKVGSNELTPGFTDFRKRVEYQTYDVTPMVASGTNVLGAVLAPGWHGSPLLWSGVRRFAGPDALRAQLVLTYADGTRQVVATDASWRASNSAVTSAEIYGGESFDARREQKNWARAGFHAASWAAVDITGIDPGVVVDAEPDTPVQQRQTLHPVSMVTLSNTAVPTQVFDMGQNMVGVARLHVTGPRGATVRLRFAERLNQDGSIYTENLRDADATDYYTLRGQGDEVWQPGFTFHGFRYIELTGYPGTPTTASVEGEVWNSLSATPSMQLKTSSELVNKMDQLGLWGQRGNFVSIPTDCPQRDERMGWMGDAGAFWRTGSYNFDIDAFTHKFMLDVVDSQKSDGAFSNISPDLLVEEDHGPGAPGWGDAGVLVPYATWLQYGDRDLIERNWDAMERWMQFIERTNPSYLREKDLGPNYGDWLAPDPHTPRDLVGTAYWALIAREMETMAHALGRSTDAAKYAATYDKVRAAYAAKYVAADGTLPGDTQTDYVVTLAAGLAPQALEKAMTTKLVENIARHQDHLTTGFLGTPYLLSVLDQEGRADVAYTLLTNDTYPSWGYMVAKGATTWWERWNGDTGDPSMNSYNHYAFGSVMAWVYRRGAGIDADPSSPGFRHILIAPQITAVPGHMHAEYQSAYGLIMTDWTRNADGTLRLNMTVPANTTATVSVPGSGVMLDGATVTSSKTNDVTRLELGSGTYRLQSKL